MVTKHGKRTSKAWPDGLNRRIVIEPSSSSLEPEDLERFLKLGQAALLDMLLEALGVRPGDYRTGLLRLAELYVPAFKTRQKRGAKPGRRAANLGKLLDAVEAIKRSGVKTDGEALVRLDPDLRGAKAKVKRQSKKQLLSEARRLRKQPTHRHLPNQKSRS